MVSFRVVSDSTADFPPSIKIPLAPVHVYVGVTDFQDKVDFTKERYLDAESKGAELRTSAPSPKDWLRAYEAAGNDLPIIAFAITSRLSSSARAAELAAKLAKKDGFDVRVLDTLSGGVGMGLLIREALRMAEQGVPVGEAYQRLLELRERLTLYVLLADPRAVVRSGRMPKLVANVGFALGFRPIITVVDGKFQLYKITRASSVPGLFAELVGDAPEVWFSEVYETELSKKTYESVSARVPAVQRIPVGPALSVHFGRGSFGVAFFKPQ
jgi:DegV family protein with EDD domain